MLFRCVRLVLTGGIVAGAASYVMHITTSATSDQAYINAEVVMLRAPIEGELKLDQRSPGTMISQGTPVFTIQNSRFGNQEASAQLNALQELTERLQAEADEAAVVCLHQESVCKLHEKLHAEKVISDLQLSEEQTKLAVARTALTNRQLQARQAAARASSIQHQVELQKEAIVKMPFNGVVWAVPSKAGAQVAAHDPVLQVIDPKRIWVDAFFREKHANKIHQGALVTIRALDGNETWQGRVESIRAGIGRIAYENFTAALPVDYTTCRIAVRIAIDLNNPYDASQFFGVGRSVLVSLNDCQ